MNRTRTFLVAALLLGGVASSPAWLRTSFSDAEIVSRAELVVVGHIKDGTMKLVNHRDGHEHHVDLLISEVLKGSIPSNTLTVSIHYGLDPFTNGGTAAVEIWDTGNSQRSGSPVSGDLRTNQIWLLRQEKNAVNEDTDWMGIYDPEDIQPLSRKAELMKYLPPPVVPGEALEQAKRRFPLLRPDMTPEQVFTTLGLTSYYGLGPVMGSGPLSHHWTEWQLPGGHAVMLIMAAADESTGSTVVGHPRLISVSLDGATWPPPNDTNNVEPQAKASTLADPIDNLVAKLSADHLWRNGAVQMAFWPVTTPPEQSVKQILAMYQITNYMLLTMRTVQIRDGLPDQYTAALIWTGPEEKIVLFNYTSPSLGWWHRIYDAAKAPVMAPEAGAAENPLKNFAAITNGMTRAEVERRLVLDGGPFSEPERFIDPQCPGFKIRVEFSRPRMPRDLLQPRTDPNRAVVDGDRVVRVTQPYREPRITD
jgi:hypothetical protein